MYIYPTPVCKQMRHKVNFKQNLTGLKSVLIFQD